MALSRVQPGRAGLSRAADAVPEGPPGARPERSCRRAPAPVPSTVPFPLSSDLHGRGLCPDVAVSSRSCACRVFCGCCFQGAAEAGAVGRAVPLGQRGWRTDRLLTGEAGAAPLRSRRPPGKTQSSAWLSRHHRASENSPEASSALGLGRPGVRAPSERGARRAG